ncbi:MAG: bifunctional 2-polyprenyl-6-hydroxyphenol methylase/3-demethylubiquinol 3-O-methyltransferase UbiG, partial [Gammaproteobacteria bacterium]
MRSENVNFAFGDLADHWWDTQGPMQVLHAMNQPRFQYIASHADLWQKKVLDLGCGAGILSEALKRQGADLTAVDQAPELIQTAKAHANTQNLEINYQMAEATSFCLTPENQAAFDVITCMELIEHVPNPQALIQARLQALKP